MKSWRTAIKDGITTGLVATAATGTVVAWRGQHDSDSAFGPINASSHLIWGEQAGKVSHFSWSHTLPGALINTGAGIWWGVIFQKLFGELADQHGLAGAVLGGTATAALAYTVDYHLIPKRLTPGWELRTSPASLFMTMGGLAAGLAVGAMLSRRV